MTPDTFNSLMFILHLPLKWITKKVLFIIIPICVILLIGRIFTTSLLFYLEYFPNIDPIAAVVVVPIVIIMSLTSIYVVVMFVLKLFGVIDQFDNIVEKNVEQVQEPVKTDKQIILELEQQKRVLRSQIADINQQIKNIKTK